MKKFLNIKHNEVAQNWIQNLHLHKKLIKFQVLNSLLRWKIKILRLNIIVQGTSVIREK